jgi:hypothetical protein
VTNIDKLMLPNWLNAFRSGARSTLSITGNTKSSTIEVAVPVSATPRYSPPLRQSPAPRPEGDVKFILCTKIKTLREALLSDQTLRELDILRG